MFAGVNQAIISTSKKYAYAAVFMVITLILIIITNWIFIPIYGIAGAAFASFLSMFITTIIRYIFVWKSFNLQPYNYKHLIIIGISGLTYFILIIIPDFPNAYIDILIKGSIITVIFGALIYISKVSEDINLKIEQVYQRYARR